MSPISVGCQVADHCCAEAWLMAMEESSTVASHIRAIAPLGVLVYHVCELIAP
jgi:hypothetical protein